MSDTSVSQLATFNENLTAFGKNVYAYNEGNNSFISKGAYKQSAVSVLPAVRNNLNQTQCDSASSPNGLTCIAYTEVNGGSTSYKYCVIDTITGQNVLAPTTILPTAGAVTGFPRVFVLQNVFVIVFSVTISAANRLQFFGINYNSLSVIATKNLSSTYTASPGGAFDGVVCNGNLYLAWNSSSSAGILVAYISPSLAVSFFANRDTLHQATLVSVCTDNSIIYVSYYNSTGGNGYVFGINQLLNSVFSAQLWIAGGNIANLTSAAQSGVATLYYENTNAYSYDAGIPTNYVSKITCSNVGGIGTATVLKRSVGLASKPFIIDGTIYVTTTYSSTLQPTYFILDNSANVITAFAYQNGGGYLTTGLPSVTVTNNVGQFCYLFKDLITTVNKGTNVTAGSQVSQIYSQTGINLMSVKIGNQTIYNAEIGKNLNLSGGFLWGYDGNACVENNFFLYPDNVECSWSTTGGSIQAQPGTSGINTNAYYYQVTYEWTDNQGNAFRSAPSVPVSVTTTGSGTTGSITVNVPTLRLTYKTANPVKIVIYRWSVAQQSYYQVTSITSPVLNNTTVDSISYVDTLADSSILGNNLLYTTGGVIENTFAPSSNAITLFDNRLWLVDGEDPNLLWFSKTVVLGAPVEMSDLLTLYISPTQAAQGSTGPILAIAPMDDKLIIFKKDAIYYIGGTGPDNTGANSQYTQPIFIASTVGSALQNSIALIPQGLVFQSDKGIWLLGRDLSTNYIGAPVENYTQTALVETTIVVPGTNQVRFTMNSGVTLMYDYYFQQWGTFTGIPGISSIVYQGLHTFLNPYSQIQQETPNKYLDITNPVLMQFSSSWIALAGIEGYQRAYFLFILGEYLSPHKVILDVAYDFNPTNTQQVIITPDNYSAPFGSDVVYGASPVYGGSSQVEQWRMILQNQRCQSIQVTMKEIFDYSSGLSPGAGLTLSGMSLIVGAKKGYVPLSKFKTVG